MPAHLSSPRAVRTASPRCARRRSAHPSTSPPTLPPSSSEPSSASTSRCSPASATSSLSLTRPRTGAVGSGGLSGARCNCRRAMGQRGRRQGDPSVRHLRRHQHHHLHPRPAVEQPHQRHSCGEGHRALLRRGQQVRETRRRHDGAHATDMAFWPVGNRSVRCPGVPVRPSVQERFTRSGQGQQRSQSRETAVGTSLVSASPLRRGS